MRAWIPGSQVILQSKIRDFDLILGCITKSLTPHNDQGQPIHPSDLVLQHIEGLEKELSLLDEHAWELTGFEREKIISEQIDPLDERLRDYKIYFQSIENANWDGFELPKEADLEASFVSGLIDSHYHSEEVDRFLQGNTESLENQKPPSVEPKLSRSTHSQECSKKCRQIAKRIWDRQPDFTIAAMVNHSEIVHQAKQLDGSPYSEATIRNWIRDLCPNRKPGRRAT